MLALLRRKAQSPYIQATVVAIIVVFMFWGVGVNQGPGRNDVATINGEPVTYATFQQTYEQTLDRYRQQFGGSIPEALREQLDLERQVLNQLIQKTLLQQGGRQMGIHISDLEVQKTIENMEVFQVNGAFDRMRYEEVLKNAGLTPSKFEKSMRTDILANKVAFHIQNFSGLTPRELDDLLNFYLSERKIGYVAVQTNDYMDQVDISEAEIERYFEENQNRYKTRPEVKLHYLYFSGNSTAGSAEITEQMIADYYAKHQEDYSIPEKRRASHILIEAEPEAENIEEKRRKMEDILARAREGEDFAELARQYSEDQLSAPQGGDLGSFPRGQMVKPFEEAVFNMTEGEISDIVRTRFGFHIIKLREVMPARTEPLAEVRDEIEEKLRRNEAERIAFARANEAYEQIIKAGSLSAYADASGVVPEKTDFFSITAPPGLIADNQRVLNKVFQLNEGELSSIIEGEDGYFIIYVKERREPHIPDLARVKDEVKEDLRKNLASDLAEKEAREILEKARDGSGGLKAAIEETEGVELSDSKFFSRNERNGNLPAPIISEAFSLTEEKPYPEKAIRTGDSYYVIHLKEVRKPVPDQIKEEKEKYRNEMLRAKRDQIINSWLDYMMQKSEIRINQERLDL